MIQLSGAGKRFGPKLLFENLDWLITPHDRVGLVGANGTGKSTLLKVLARLEPLDYGAISSPKGITAGYLPQDGLHAFRAHGVRGMHVGVRRSARHGAGDGRARRTRWRKLDPAGPEYAQVADRFHRHRQPNSSTATDMRSRRRWARCWAVWDSRSDDWHRRTEEFSGGWQMRIALAKLLLEKPNLLLLDEPTNHLDLEARNWLEEYLHDYPHAFVLISHDRYFLDVTVEKIGGDLEQEGPFLHRQLRKVPEAKDGAARANRSGLSEPAGAHRAARSVHQPLPLQATKAKQVQSRIKELEKIERIEIPKEEKTIHFKFPQPKPSGRDRGGVPATWPRATARSTFSAT